MQTPDQAISGHVQGARERSGMSQADLAKAMTRRGHDFRQQTIYSIENGKRRVTVGEAVDLATVLGVSLDELVHGGMPAQLSREIQSWRAEHSAYEQATRQYVAALVSLAEASDREAIAARVAKHIESGDREGIAAALLAQDADAELADAVAEVVSRRTPARVADARWFAEALVTSDQPRGAAQQALLDSVIRDHDLLGDPNG